MNVVRVGTSGFSYKEWKGHFYPDDLKEADFLSYYSGRLGTVEINNTFYRMPRRDVLKKWRESTPDNFRFVIKASRRITHFKRLKDTSEPMEYLLRNIESLGDKLGAILFQLPPTLRCNLERLERFVELIPEDVAAVMEFRHESWQDDEVHNILKANNIATCVNDDDLTGDIPVTADFSYLRLRKPAYTAGDLAGWAKFLAENRLKETFVYFKHETEGAGPALAEKFSTCIERHSGLKVAAG